MAKRVLIVEDEIFVAMEMEYALSQKGHEVIGIAPDTSSALAIAKKGADVALVDLNLRDGQTGKTIAEQLAADYGVKVLFMTANPALIGSGVPGAIGVLSKPCTGDTVAAALDYALMPHDVPPPRGLNLFEGVR